MRRVLRTSFFNRDTKTVAKELLGKFLVRKIGGKIVSAMIVQTEAYDGFEDKASHASSGKTARNEPMFGKAGIFYVYLVYGRHYMLNVVTGENGYPAAVLICGAEGTEGPGRLTKLLQVDKKLNGAPASKNSGLWFEDRGVVFSGLKIKKAPRVGVSYAGPIWSRKKMRFLIDIDRG